MEVIFSILSSILNIFSSVFSSKNSKDQRININNSTINNGNINQVGGDIITESQNIKNENVKEK